MTEDVENTDADHVVLRPERRRKLRNALLVLRVESESGGENTLFGYAKSIAPNGMFIATVNPKPVGSQFMICFELPETGTKVTCSCRVMWNRDYDPDLKNEPGMGIMFLDLLAGHSKEIEGWIAEEGRKNKKTRPRFIADRESKALEEARAAAAVGEHGPEEAEDAGDVKDDESGKGGTDDAE